MAMVSKATFRVVLCLLLAASILSLSGCSVKFTLVGADSYVIMPDGDVLNGSLEESEIEIEVLTSGSGLKGPVSMDIEIEGLIMGDSDPEAIGNYIKGDLGFDSVTFDAATDTFHITGEYGIDDFWTGLGITSVGLTLGPFIVPLGDIIGDIEAATLVECIVEVENSLMGEGSTIDFELSGVLREVGGSKVGTFILWLDAINPV